MIINKLTLTATVLKWEGNRFPFNMTNFNKLFNHGNREVLNVCLSVLVRNSLNFQLISGDNHEEHPSLKQTDSKFEHLVT